MNTKFKRHERVRLLATPREQDVEPYKDPPVKIVSGMEGTINILLPNGRYHVKISDKKGDEVAYVAMDEEQLESI
jgi:hypothetical protein